MLKAGNGFLNNCRRAANVLKQALAQLKRQQDRLLKAYLAEVIDLAEFERKRREIAQKQQALQTQLRQLEAQTEKRIEVAAIATSIESILPADAARSERKLHSTNAGNW